MSLRNDKKDARRYSVGNIGKWLALGTEVPIMVLVGVYIGRYLGEQFGDPTSVFWIIVGAVLGLLVGAYNMVKIVRIWEAREAAAKAKAEAGKKSQRPEYGAYNGFGEQSVNEAGVGEDEEKWQRIIELLKKQMILDDSFQPAEDENQEKA